MDLALLHMYTEVFGSTGFGNTKFSGTTDIFPISILNFSMHKVQSNGFTGITDKMDIPTDSVQRFSEVRDQLGRAI